MTYSFCVKGAFWGFFLSSPFPGRSSGPLHACLVFNSDKWSNFLKSIRSAIRKQTFFGMGVVGGALPNSYYVPVRWWVYPDLFYFICTNRITFAFHSMVMHILGMMVCCCTSFELTWCQLQQFSFHCSKKEKGSSFWLLPVSDCCETLYLAFCKYIFLC